MQIRIASMDTQLTVRLPLHLDRKVTRLAKRLRLKRSDVVRLALEQFLGDAVREEQRPYSRVKDLLGSIDTGIPDLGTDHRKHLLQRLKRA
jgi:predicted transcriptional regulator